MGPIDTTVAPRPTLPTTGAASSGLSTQNDVLQKLNEQLSLSEGLVKRRQEFATSGPGRAAYDALSDPNKVMTGLDPNSNLTQGIDLRSGYESSIAKAGANTMDVLTAINSIFKQRKDAENETKRLSNDEIKLKADLMSKNITIDEVTGEPRGMTADELKNKASMIGSVDIKGASKTDMELAKGVYKAQQALEGAFNPTLTGPIDVLTGTANLLTNQGNAKDVAKFRQVKAEANTAIRKYISGSAISPSEETYLKDLVIGPLDSDTQVQAKIQGLKDWSLRKAGSILETSGYTDIDPNEYLGTGIANTQQTKENQNKTIRVKVKSSGQTGTIPESEFDSKIYDRI